MAAIAVSSASGLLAMLNEHHPLLKLYALTNLNRLVDNFWPEISTSVPTIESLYEDEEFDQRQLAALSLCVFCNFCVAKAIDEYATLRVKAAESNEEALQMDPRLELIVERMLDKCIVDGKFQQALGIALECRRLDKLEEAIMKSDNVPGMLSYCINVSQTFVSRREYRCERTTKKDVVDVWASLTSPKKSLISVMDIKQFICNIWFIYLSFKGSTFKKQQFVSW
ncbi:hypothetical protein KI387_027478 [Taxus chinensis]|uniref:26S proteasome non-ATPase regulatory subunit 1/RPN2 N-terminal domain-containing protein n=1 Tax=Taxus chinensis TaxID=29808 RepID=A0AA38FY95_TAXCH|nr:hypothetical protein KI387_027478 [Taxus chinensis]